MFKNKQENAKIVNLILKHDNTDFNYYLQKANEIYNSIKNLPKSNSKTIAAKIALFYYYRGLALASTAIDLKLINSNYFDNLNVIDDLQEKLFIILDLAGADRESISEDVYDSIDSLITESFFEIEKNNKKYSLTDNEFNDLINTSLKFKEITYRHEILFNKYISLIKNDVRNDNKLDEVEIRLDEHSRWINIERFREAILPIILGLSKEQAYIKVYQDNIDYIEARIDEFNGEDLFD